MDIGGTNIKAGIADSKGQLFGEVSVPTPVKEGKEAIIACMKKLIEELRVLRPEMISAIGIGSAGRIDTSAGRVVYATDNLPGWMGTNLREVIEEACSLPVFIDNDVNAAAWGEGWLGAAQGSSHYVLVTLGTGVGGALVHNGQLINGPRGGAGEVGHLILYPRGTPCNCGQAGCLEQYVSGTALNRLARTVNSDWNSYDLMKQVAAADPRAIELIDRFAEELATGLISIQNIYDPERIIIGGGLMETHPLWWDRLASYAVSGTLVNMHIVPAQLGNRAGILGAARLALDHVTVS